MPSAWHPIEQPFEPALAGRTGLHEQSSAREGRGAGPAATVVVAREKLGIDDIGVRTGLRFRVVRPG